MVKIAAIPHVFISVGFVFLVLGICNREGVRRAVGDFWTKLAYVRWGELVGRDAARFIRIIEKIFHQPWTWRYFTRVLAISALFNAMILATYFLVEFKGPYNIGSGNLYPLFLMGIIVPGMIVDFVSLTVTFYLMYLVVRLAQFEWYIDYLIYVGVICVDLILLMSFLDIGFTVFEEQQAHINETLFGRHYMAPAGNIERVQVEYNQVRFIKSMLSSVVQQAREPIGFFQSQVSLYLYIGKKYGASYIPVIVCLFTIAIPTIVHLMIMFLFTLAKFFQRALKPLTLTFLNGAYKFGATWLGRHATCIGGWLMAIGSATVAYQTLFVEPK